MPRRRNRTGRKGGQLRNQNARKHGGYSQSFTDHRRKEARYVEQIERELIEAVGGTPTPSQLLLIKRIAVKSFRLSKAEAEIVANNGVASNALGHDYLSWSTSLRSDLAALCLNSKDTKLPAVRWPNVNAPKGVLKLILLPAPAPNPEDGKHYLWTPDSPILKLSGVVPELPEHQHELEPPFSEVDSAERTPINGEDHGPNGADDGTEES